MCWLEDEPKGIKPVGRPKKAENKRRHDIHPSVSFDTKAYLYSRVDSDNHEIKAGVYIDQLVEADKVKLNYQSEG